MILATWEVSGDGVGSVARRFVSSFGRRGSSSWGVEEFESGGLDGFDFMASTATLRARQRSRSNRNAEYFLSANSQGACRQLQRPDLWHQRHGDREHYQAQW